MKKQMLAKLVVLGMVAAMLPIAAIAADKETTEETKCELTCTPVDMPVTPPERPEASSSSSSLPESTPSTTVTVQTTTNADGKVVASAPVTATMSGSTATEIGRAHV